MRTALRSSLPVSLAASLFLLSVSALLTRAETPTTTTPPAAKLPLKAVLVLTPEFCATKFKQGSILTTGRETFKVGKLACTELEPALKPAFDSLTVATAPPTSGDAQLILTPKFANAHATTSVLAFSSREMDVFLEWTIKDAAGKTVWLQTVQGSSKHMTGNIFFAAHQSHRLVSDSVKDAAVNSAQKMEAAPELRALAAAPATPAN